MPTIAEACSLLGVSRPTLKKFLVRLKIEPEPHPLDQRVLLLSSEQLQTLREVLDQRPVKRTGQKAPPHAPGWPTVPRAIPSPVEVPPPARPARPPVDHYRPSGGHSSGRPSSSQEALAAHPLPEGWMPFSSWCLNHGIDRRTALRKISARHGQLPKPEYAPEGEEWGKFSQQAGKYYPAAIVYRSDQLAEAARVAREEWPDSYHPCTDPVCPCKS